MGSQTREERKKKEKGRKKKKEPSTIKTTSFSLSNLGSFQGRGKAVSTVDPPSRPPSCFSQEANPGAFSMCPSRQNNEALEA